MITPRTTRLLRVPDLRAFQDAIIASIPREGAAARDTVVIVPSRGAAEELRRTIENRAIREAQEAKRAVALVLPDLVTRDELYARLRERLASRGTSGAALTEFDREVLLRRAALEVRQRGVEPPFNIRAGLVAEILGLYDELRRRGRSVSDFERLMVGALQPGADYDRGAARLLQQTVFLAAAFGRFEEAIAALGAVDEHRLRAMALESDATTYRHAIVTVADQAADRRGLWSEDFNLLARLPGLAHVDVVATDALLDAGFLQRLHDLLPGIEEQRAGQPCAPPVFVAPAAPATGRSDAFGASHVFVCRDREEELAAFAQTLKTAPRLAQLERTAIVFQRPLPYLYLARQVFADARVAWQALDALPLAGEPFAAAIDVIFSALAADFTRGSLVDLLRCPHFSFPMSGGDAVDRRGVSALNRFLIEQRYLGTLERLERIAGFGPPEAAAAAAAARELLEVMDAPDAAAQIDAILAFITAHERLPEPSDPWFAGHLRARAAVLSALAMLRDAHAAHDRSPLSVAELAGAVRRWIEGQTFAPRQGSSGVVLLDARAAAYADLDEVRIVGLTEADWPERRERSIFYPQSLLSQLGWPNDVDLLRAARTRFQDLLRLPRRRVSLSTFTLEDDALVSPSPLLEDVDAVGLRVERPAYGPESTGPRVFTHDALAMAPLAPGAVDGVAAEWLALRAARDCGGARFKGAAGRRAAGVYAVSRIERYLECPFKYFAGHVLKLPEERDEQGWMTPQERGQFVHEVFETFFAEWQRGGRGAITTENVREATGLFAQIAEARLEKLPEGDRALERTLLLGSAAAAGLAERAFAFEIEQAIAVDERLLEYELEDTFSFAAGGECRAVRIRAKADRIDLLEDGTLRVIDYKLGRAPEKRRSLQLPIYGICATQKLDGYHGRSWPLSRAGYVAFKDRRSFVEIGDLPAALSEGQEKLVAAVDAIERGEFPVQPDEPYLCNWCPYPSVCRKDYVGDE